MRSSWSLGFVYIALGGLSVSGIGGHRPLTPAAWTIAALLVAAGAFLFTRLRAAFYVALAVAALTSVSGVVALAHHPELALPVWPWVSIGVGLYLILRIAMASPSFGGKKKGFIP
ncbi:MAG TPA: hypothetical protein VHB97_26630 [Polyangia bacterium]|nr:hypothetical protein [Polyangia bacterium]